jgi:hypothetical protein
MMPKDQCYSEGCTNSPTYHFYLMEGSLCHHWWRFCTEHIDPAKEAYSNIFEVNIKTNQQYDREFRDLIGL